MYLSREPLLFARETDGVLVCTCGCDVNEAHLVGFGHLRENLGDLLSREFLMLGSHSEREAIVSPWVFGELEEVVAYCPVRWFKTGCKL